MKLKPDMLPNLDLSRLGEQYKWLTHSFPNPTQIFHEIEDQITKEQLIEYVSSRSDKVSTGPTKLKIGVLRSLDDSGINALLTLLNACLVTGTVPSSWKKILLIPLPKKHNITSLLHTRPIALLETCLKILTGIINARTLACWVKHKVLHPSQYAFLPGSSSADPVHIARCVYEASNERIKQKMLESEDFSTFIHVAYLDVAKAYDSVEHVALNISLRSLGVPEGILALMLEIDKGCTVITKTPYGYSPEAHLGRGARQGDPFS
ncbi:MAG: hypothetical protein J0651_05225, partial [Actinobacteria bacterium]|nr:hypothetical protein [Actinomycetota bacterium]